MHNTPHKYESICKMRESHKTHGMTYTPEFNCWQGILTRCLNTRDMHYSNYGGRGIFVCEEWKNSFEKFYEDMGPRPEGCSIGRKDNDGPYCKSNCEWQTAKQQAQNRRIPKNTWHDNMRKAQQRRRAREHKETE